MRLPASSRRAIEPLGRSSRTRDFRRRPSRLVVFSGARATGHTRSTAPQRQVRRAVATSGRRYAAPGTRSRCASRSARRSTRPCSAFAHAASSHRRVRSRNTSTARRRGPVRRTQREHWITHRTTSIADSSPASRVPKPRPRAGGDGGTRMHVRRRRASARPSLALSSAGSNSGVGCRAAKRPAPTRISPTAEPANVPHRVAGAPCMR